MTASASIGIDRPGRPGRRLGCGDSGRGPPPTAATAPRQGPCRRDSVTVPAASHHRLRRYPRPGPPDRGPAERRPVRQHPALQENAAPVRRADSWWRSGTPTGTAGRTRSSGSAPRPGNGGTGIAFFKDAVYAEAGPSFCVTASRATSWCPTAAADTILSGLADRGGPHLPPADHRPRRQPLREQRLGDQLLPGGGPPGRLAGRASLQGAGDAGRHLAVQRDEDGPEFRSRGRASSPASATRAASPSTPPTARSMPPSTGATNWGKTGPSSTAGSRARSCPAKS